MATRRYGNAPTDRESSELRRELSAAVHYYGSQTAAARAMGLTSTGRSQLGYILSGKRKMSGDQFQQYTARIATRPPKDYHYIKQGAKFIDRMTPQSRQLFELTKTRKTVEKGKYKGQVRLRKNVYFLKKEVFEGAVDSFSAQRPVISTSWLTRLLYPELVTV